MRFTRKRHGTVEVRADRTEAAVLGQAVGELVSLLGDRGEVGNGSSDEADPLAAIVGLPMGSGAPPADPALARLLPDAYRADTAGVEDAASASAEFRRYTEPDLRAGKRAAAITMLEGLVALTEEPGRLSLDRESADAWLGCLNDLRLVLGTRLEVTEDTMEELDLLAEADPRLPALHLYVWLGWLQESLLACVHPEAR